jgi:hypothetical protein
VSRSTAAALIEAGKNRPPPEDADARLRERDARLAADQRSPAERFLGDPPTGRSALAQGSKSQPATLKRASMRVDLWKR